MGLGHLCFEWKDNAKISRNDRCQRFTPSTPTLGLRLRPSGPDSVVLETRPECSSKRSLLKCEELWLSTA